MDKKSKGILGHIFYYSDNGKTFLILSVFLSTLGMVCNVIPYLSVYSISKIFLTSGYGNKEAVLFWIVIAGCAILLNLIFTFLGGLGCHTVAFKILYKYRIKLMKHLGKVPIGFFPKNTSGSIQKIMDENIEKLEGIIAHMMSDLIGSSIVLISLFLGIAYLNLIMAFTVLISVVIAFAFQYIIFGSENAKGRYASYMKASTNITSSFSEYVKGMAEVKLFGKTGGMSKSLENHLDECLGWEITNYKRAAFFMSIYKSIILSLLTFVVPVGGLLVLKNPTGETLLAVIMAIIIAPALYEPLLTCIDYGTQINLTKAGLTQIDGILNESIFTVKTDLDKMNGNSVLFDSVSFSYGSKADPLKKMALNNVSFTCKEKEMTALVGESGSGKSTIGQLLLRFWDVHEGSIKIGGKDIRSIETSDLMEKIAFVFQDTHIFSDTVRNNISMNRNCSEEEIIEAAKKARCHDFIMNLAKGYDTIIGSGNIKLSGGEAQRISIARAFLKDSKIIILDEALAYTDAENENLIQEAIKNLIKDKTVIVIAHRLKSIMDADKIIVLKEGKVIEKGTHEKLIADNAEYKTLWDLQFEAESWEITGKGGRM
ncbi:ABC transporter ATP-binding protein/permease [Clostridioides difficile]|nr:ABC transporter ATP-binding protein [Clostridioides difficile]MDK3169751.1 ABC transporter ATP-binding protein [Clostridioides difficile]MDN9333078.1 ABC transporter ATP-binding protein/permease [Clostridioides difficile]